jgi:hypothetical protein
VPRKAAFSYVTDPANRPGCWPDLAAVAGTARGERPGDVMRLRAKLAGRAVDLTMTLREFVEPTLVTYRSVQAGLPDRTVVRLAVSRALRRTPDNLEEPCDGCDAPRPLPRTAGCGACAGAPGCPGGAARCRSRGAGRGVPVAGDIAGGPTGDLAC